MDSETTHTNGGARVIGVPAAGASAEAHLPDPYPPDGPPPEWVVNFHDGEPYLYKLYRKED